MGPSSKFERLCWFLFFALMVRGGAAASVKLHRPMKRYLTSVAHMATPTTTFDVLKHGAIADGVRDSTEAFESAWKNACGWEGKKTRILIPKGTYLVGPLVLEGPCKGIMIFTVKGVVKAQTDLSIFKDDVWIHFKNITGLKVSGRGTFDGQGASAWPHNQCSNNSSCKLLPTSIKLSSINIAKISRISSINSKFFHMNIYKSKNIKLQSLKIWAPEDSPNTDGIHIGDSRNVEISDSIIGTGDDCISIGPGSYSVSINNIRCGPGHGISVGSLGKYADEGDVVGLEVKNCTLSGTTNGLRIKTWQDSPPSLASNFCFQDIVMNNVYNPIIIDQKYCPVQHCTQKTPSRVKITEVSFKNIWGTSASKVAVNLMCSSYMPCQNVKLININLNYNGPDRLALSNCSYANGLSSGIQNPSSCL